MLLLATEVWRHGGVQRYMRMILHIAEIYQQPCSVLSLVDDAVTTPSERLNYIGCHESKTKYCLHAFRLAVRGKARKVIVGHIGLLPVAWILRIARFTDEYTLVLHGIEAWQRIGWLHRVAARAAKSIIATTTYTAREFCYFNGIDRSRCLVIPLASDIETRQFEHSAPHDELLLVTVSRLSLADRYKGLDCLLASVRLGLDCGLPIKLQIVGSGDDMERLRSVANTLGIQHVVRFRGALSDADLELVYNESHVFVMPSKKEGFGIVYLEAMAAGLPCIAANHGGAPEVVEHGESGFLVEYGDTRQIVTYLQVLLESTGLYDSLSRRAHCRATEDLRFAVMADSWSKVLNAVANMPNLKETCERKPVVVPEQ